MRHETDSLRMEWQDHPDGAETAYRLFRLHQERCLRVRANAPQDAPPRLMPEALVPGIAVPA